MDDVTRELVTLLARGHSIPEAAVVVGIREAEARRLVDAAMLRAGATSRLALIVWAIRSGEVGG